MNMTNTVNCHNLHKSYADFPAVHGVSFGVAQGETVALVGPSGCGKTTTLRLIAGFESLDKGRIEVAGTVVDNGRWRLPPEQRRAGMVFQDYAIFPHLSVAGNVAFGLNGRRRHHADRVAAMLRFVGLAEMGERMPRELSGGQQQRVALARALAPEPAVLLLDEPFSNLDAALRHEVRAEVRRLLQKSGVTAIFVTHDQEEALFMGDRVAVMDAGHLVQIDRPETIFHRPATRFVAEFLGNADFVPGWVQSSGIQTPLGLLPQTVDLPVGTAVEIVLRPDDVFLEAEDEGNGRVLERQFVGIAYIYKVALADGTIVRSWQPHTVQFGEGTAVRARFRHQHLFSCFYQGVSVQLKDRQDGQIAL